MNNCVCIEERMMSWASVAPAKRWAVPLCLLAMAVPAAADVDAEAAEALAKRNQCFKCHAIAKKKQGPAWGQVAAKYRGKEGAEAKLVFHLTSGEAATFDDGHQEEHKIIDTTSDKEIKNLVDWILALPYSPDILTAETR